MAYVEGAQNGFAGLSQRSRGWVKMSTRSVKFRDSRIKATVGLLLVVVLATVMVVVASGETLYALSAGSLLGTDDTPTPPLRHKGPLYG
jgi:hypothetical protein